MGLLEEGKLLDRSLPQDLCGRFSAVSRHSTLKTYNVVAQQYGAFFAGFRWQYFCTGTYRKRCSRFAAEAHFSTYMSRLRRTLKAPVSFIAVKEFRTSGLGHPPIPIHWHFVVATVPRHRSALKTCARNVWERYYGNFRGEIYDPSEAGAHYLAKLASNTEFDYQAGNLDRLAYSGPSDLYECFQTDDYVPFHAKQLTSGQTLVLRASGASSTSGSPNK